MHGQCSPGMGNAPAAYIQLRHGATTSVPVFGSVPEETSDGSVAGAPVAKAAPACLGGATHLVSIFARAPVCNHTCSCCLAQPCDVDTEHDDHTCYGCEQKKLNPAGEPNTPWRAPKVPACYQLCNQCSRKKCCLRYLHDIHACYWCNLHPGCVPIPLGVGTRFNVLVRLCFTIDIVSGYHLGSRGYS